jgi:hypothetical protein
MRLSAFSPKTHQLQLNPAERADVKELAFVIALPRHVLSDVAVLKDDVHYLIGHAFEGQYARPRIELFTYGDRYAKDMIRFVESKAGEFRPFNVLLKDFGVFYHGAKRSIYMDIVYKSPIEEMFEKLVRQDAGYIPHIPIAKNLSTDDFLRCWPYLKSLNYGNQHFLCDRITVLAKTDNYWLHYKDIMFEGA